MSRNEHFAMGAGLPELSRAADAYASRMGQRRPADFSRVTANPDVGRSVARQYEAAPSFEQSAVPHFTAMREETKRQFEFMTGARRHGGLGINVEVTPHDPYGASKTEDDPMGVRSMLRDLEHGHLKVLSSASTGGHPLFTDDENAMFRAVHDTFGHAATGRSFDRHGEEAAYRSHRAMYSTVARPAMTTETRGQNSALNFGSNPGTFQEQKIVTLPNAGRIVPIGRRSVRRSQLLQAAQFHNQALGQ
jgi:hypothetical protein